jgi:hypothetical protein
VPDIQHAVGYYRMRKMLFRAFVDLEFADDLHFTSGMFNQVYVAIVGIAIQMVIGINNASAQSLD